MKILVKFLALGALLSIPLSGAQANPVTGTLTIDGGQGAINPAVLNGSTRGLSTSGIVVALGGSGSLASVPMLEFVTFASNFTFSVGGPSLIGESLFAFIENGIVETFDVNSVTLAPNGSLTFYGVLTDGSPAGSANGSYVLTPNVSGDGSFSSTLDIPHAPEPDSLYLMGTGLAVLAGVLSLRRRRAPHSPY